jgi:hypothetical protein
MATSTALTNTNISDTYKGVLHAMGTQLPAQGLQYIHDGDGNRTSLQLGRTGQGISVTGGVATTGSVVLYAIGGTGVTNTLNLSTSTYPRIQFGGFNSNAGTDNTDAMYITRVNTASDRSELRINIGDNIGASSVIDSFIVGGTTSSQPNLGFRPILSLSGNGNMTVQLPVHTTPYQKPAGWGGGVTSFDFYSDGGSFGAGYSGTLNAYFNSDGNFVGKTYSSTSSIQYKTNVKPLENALEIINKLDGVRFDWKDTGKSDIGLIAEDVDKVLPEFVIKDEETGKPQGVDYGKITSVLIEAVKELTKLVTK